MSTRRRDVGTDHRIGKRAKVSSALLPRRPVWSAGAGKGARRGNPGAAKTLKGSLLALRAVMGDALDCLAADSLAAHEAGFAHPPVDPEALPRQSRTRRARPRRAIAQEKLPAAVDERGERCVVQGRYRPVRIAPFKEQRLAFDDVSHAGHCRLIEQGLFQGCVGQGPQAAQRFSGVESIGGGVGPRFERRSSRSHSTTGAAKQTATNPLSAWSSTRAWKAGLRHFSPSR